MIRTLFFGLLVILAWPSKGADSLAIPRFGKIVIYHPQSSPQALVLFVSGDGGWSPKLEVLAKRMALLGPMVVGIDIHKYYSYLKKIQGTCYYPAADFEMLSLMLQKKFRWNQYMKPILLGYSSGATLVYGILAQAPANTFKGAIAMGFCPDLEIDKPLCNGLGLTTHVLKEGQSYFLERTDKLTAPFIVLQGKNDLLCLHYLVEDFLKDMKMAELLSIPQVGHGLLYKDPWMRQIDVAYNKVLKAPLYPERMSNENVLLQNQHLAPAPGNLPLTLIPAVSNDTMPLAIFISGDGGWTSFDHAICTDLARKGVPVIGLDAQKYFWNGRTPQETSNGIAGAILHFEKQWNKRTFILVGYSLGACIVPFVADMLPVPLKRTMLGVIALSPDTRADFEIHISDMLNMETSKDAYDVLAEIRKSQDVEITCVFGNNEDKKLRDQFENMGAKILTLPGGHNFDNNSLVVANAILKAVF